MVTKYVKAGAIHVTQNAFAISASLATTVGLFILLPVINAIAEGARADTLVIPVESSEIPPPPDAIEEEEPEPEEPEEEEEPPELEEESEPLDLAQLEMLMSSDFGSGGVGAVDFKIDLSNVTGGGGVEGLFDMSELDGKPTAIDRPQPSLNAKEKKATPGRVVVIFIVDSRGRVQKPKVQSSSDPALEAAALRTVKKWRFQPGTRKGKAVSTRSRQTIDFPKQ
ncbi:Gram-negative bacterial tonB protein [Planctomycetes bacterium Poly30]|uniref:Gram-negative bacterial tonB protein n=1 Tax=Saltatorellus ferox TaxID=2528018 RepID=A0A518EMB3_9BACT|nr:Gram-negative bacterial tonB protein [Planctomycetes bacterium Poly30]